MGIPTALSEDLCEMQPFLSSRGSSVSSSTDAWLLWYYVSSSADAWPRGHCLKREPLTAEGQTRPLPSLGNGQGLTELLQSTFLRVSEGPVSYGPSHMASANVHPGTGVLIERFE